MPTYISFGKYTDQGARNIKDAISRLNVVQRAIQQAGGKLVGWYMMLGEYDLATVVELPDDETALRLALEVGQFGNLRTTAMRAFTRDEVERVIGRMD